MKRRIVAWILVGFLSACGGAGTKSESISETSLVSEATSPSVAAPEKELPPPPPSPIVEVHRGELDALLDQGAPHILQLVQIDSHKEKGRFKGFRIVSFRIDADEVLGLRADDVVTKVNGLPIERPEQFIDVLKKLKVAANISFQIIRDGKEEELTTPILP